MWAYRVTRHDASGFSPYFLQYGREPRVPLSRLVSKRQPEDADAVHRFDLLTDAFCQSASNTEYSCRYNHQRLAQRARAGELVLGDKVLLRVSERAPMDPHWDFLFTVVAVRGPVVTIADQRSGARKVLNRDKLLLVDPDLDWDHVNPRVKRHRRPPHQPGVPSATPIVPGPANDVPQFPRLADPNPPTPSTSSGIRHSPAVRVDNVPTLHTPMDEDRPASAKRPHIEDPFSTDAEPCSSSKKVRQAAIGLGTLYLSPSWS